MKGSRITSWLPSRLGIMGINRRNREFVYQLNERAKFPNVDDKLRCKEILSADGIAMPRTLHVIDSIRSLKCWEEKVADYASFVIKPNSGSGGRGILLVRREEDMYRVSGELLDAEDITAHIRRIMSGVFGIDNLEDTAYIEETVRNHPGINQFLSDPTLGVADIRLIHRGDQLVMAMLRIPTEASGGKANLHQGGLGVGIDLETGLSIGGCYAGKHVWLHPETGLPLSGQPIPEFDKMRELGIQISRVIGLGYIGIDFVCDADHGAQVLEVNARPGLAIQIANMDGLLGRLRQ